MRKNRLKGLIGLGVILLAAALFVGVMAALAQIVIFTGTGADRAAALNLVPALPADLEQRVTWLTDAPTVTGQRALEPVVRQQVTGAYMRGLAQMAISYELGRPYGLATYFGGPVLVQVTDAISATAATGLALRQSSLSHALQLTFYADDGSVVAFRDNAARLVQQVKDSASGQEQVIVQEGAYDVVMFLEDGNWRIRAWRRVGDAEPQPMPLGGLPGSVRVTGSQLTVNGAPYRIAGVNYYPSATPWTLFWPNYDPQQTAVDLAAARALDFNTIRVFVPFTDFGGADVDPEMVAHLRDLLDQAQAQGLRVIVTLFDHRTDHAIGNWTDDEKHLAGLIPALAWHPAILAWDIKNEADRDTQLNGAVLNEAWLRHMIGQLRSYDRNHLVTVGWSTPAAASALVDVVDFVSFHYYGAVEDYARQVQGLVDQVGEQPIVLGEFGASSWQWLRPGQLGEESQAKYLGDLLLTQQLLAKERAWPLAGDIVWTLYDFTEVPLAEFRLPWRKAAQASMGLLHSDGANKPAAAIIQSNNR